MIDQSGEMAALQGQLRSAQLPSGTCGSSTFLPYSVLEQEVTPESITKILPDRKSKYSEAISEIASFVCGKPGARRIFAVLVFLGCPDRIDLFYEHKFVDSILPLYVTGTKKVQVRTHSAETGHSDITRKVFADEFWKRSMSPWMFSDNQWQFLGPVFSEHQFRYSFRTEHRMPFLGQPGGHRESHFSTVGKWSIHKSHFKKSSRLVSAHKPTTEALLCNYWMRHSYDAAPISR